MDKEKEILTAEEFLDQYACKFGFVNWNEFIFEVEDLETVNEHFKTLMVEFAKWHRSQAIEAIKEKAEIKRKTSGDSPLNYESTPYICLNSIENAYKQDNIV